MTSSSQNDEKVVVSFHNSDIYESDLHLLTPPNWLNDAIMNFCCDYMRYEMFAGKEKDFMFVYPGSAHIMMNGDDEDVADVVDGLQLATHTHSLIFIFVSNAEVTSMHHHHHQGMVGVGSHWSLLVYSKQKARFYHFDSYSNHNHVCARTLASRLAPFLIANDRRHERSSSSVSSSGAVVSQQHGNHHRRRDGERKTNVDDSDDVMVDVACSQQHNSYDCGVYAIAFAIELARTKQQLNNNNDNDDTAVINGVRQKITSQYVTQLRATIKSYIHDTAKRTVK